MGINGPSNSLGLAERADDNAGRCCLEGAQILELTCQIFNVARELWPIWWFFGSMIFAGMIGDGIDVRGCLKGEETMIEFQTKLVVLS
jgi:hypothetical protein